MTRTFTAELTAVGAGGAVDVWEAIGGATAETASGVLVGVRRAASGLVGKQAKIQSPKCPKANPTGTLTHHTRNEERNQSGTGASHTTAFKDDVIAHALLVCLVPIATQVCQIQGTTARGGPESHTGWQLWHWEKQWPQKQQTYHTSTKFKVIYYQRIVTFILHCI